MDVKITPRRLSGVVTWSTVRAMGIKKRRVDPDSPQSNWGRSPKGRRSPPIPAMPVSAEFSPEALAEAALADKKRSGGSITLVVPKRIGLCELKTVPVTELLPVIRAGWEA